MGQKVKILIVALVVCISYNAFSQRIPLQLEREFLLNALDLLDSYEYCSTLRNNDAASTFRGLFAGDDVKLYNDLLGISGKDELAVSEYITLMRQNAVSPIVKLKNVRKKSLKEDGEKLILVLDFEKELRYNNTCGAILSSTAYYDNNDYNMEMVISMDKKSKICVIESLKGSVDSKKPRLGDDFAIVEFNDKRDYEVENQGERLNFNVFDQAFIPMPYNLTYPDDDANMKIIQEDPACNKLRFSYHPVRWSIKPHANISLGQSYSINEDSPLLDISSSSLEFGLDFGYTFPMKSKFKVALFTGVGFATGKIDMGVNALNYHYQAGSNADMDGDTYVRYYEISDLHQNISLSHFVLPIYADFSYKFNKYVQAFVQVGVKSYFNIGSKVNDFTGKMFAYGVYPQYKDLMIDATYMNDFGNSEIEEKAQNELKFMSTSFDALLGIGVRAKIYGPLWIEAGVNYQLGLTEVVEAPTTPGVLVDGSISESQALVTYTVSGGTRIKNLTDYLGSIKRNSLKLNVGLIFKF